MMETVERTESGNNVKGINACWSKGVTVMIARIKFDYQISMRWSKYCKMKIFNGESRQSMNMDGAGNTDTYGKIGK